MNTRRRLAAVATALATAVTGTALVPTQVDAAGRVPTIKAVVRDTSIRMSTHRVDAGQVRFTVVAASGDHTLQLVKLRKWYSWPKFVRDSENAFMGMTMAVQRVDRGTLWSGGAEAKQNHPGRFAQVLTAGTYYLFDQNGPSVTKLDVTGAVTPRGGPATSSTIVGTSRERFRAPATIPRRGWTLFKVTSDEPCYLVMRHVKHGTTRAQAGRFVRSENRSLPAWMRRGSAASGVISGGTQTRFHYNLPRGQYLLSCWFPSEKTGMPHATMGMFRMVNLR
ncbi:MAG TPA: hypothetical protein VFT75_11015 [Nocardioidaceae bacterium]|nr:hypothetical protein [Nocardioidaceae bacterium]